MIPRAVPPSLPEFKGFNIGCCRGNALEILRDVEAHALASSYSLRVVTVNGAEAKKYIFAFVTSNEPGAYLLIEPFYFSRRHGYYPPSFDNFKDKLVQLPAEENRDQM